MVNHCAPDANNPWFLPRKTLRYHGDSPLVSLLVKERLVEAVAYPQSKVLEAAVQFARTEGTLPAPEPAHAIRAVIDEALRCKSATSAPGDRSPRGLHHDLDQQAGRRQLGFDGGARGGVAGCDPGVPHLVHLAPVVDV
jgi:hypothetical protein